MIKKAIIPVAGYGTRFLPATKSLPKELLPIVDTPVIQFIVEEAAAAGIEDIIIVTSRNKRAIEDHFDRYPELENTLRAKGDTVGLEQVMRPTRLARLHFVRQQEMRGLGDALLQARDHIGNEPFAVLLGDTIHKSATPGIAQLAEAYGTHTAPIIGLEEVALERAHMYGIAAGNHAHDGLIALTDLVEKPAKGTAPSNLAIAARYVLTPEIFEILATIPVGKNGEVQLTDALRVLLNARSMYGKVLAGKRHDIGDRTEYVKATIEYALERPDMAEEIRAFIQTLGL